MHLLQQRDKNYKNRFEILLDGDSYKKKSNENVRH